MELRRSSRGCGAASWPEAPKCRVETVYAVYLPDEALFGREIVLGCRYIRPVAFVDDGRVVCVAKGRLIRRGIIKVFISIAGYPGDFRRFNGLCQSGQDVKYS